MCFDLYSPSNFYSIAVNLPNGGDINLISIPDMKYHPTIRPGPSHPTNSANFLENKKISRTGLVKLRYKLARL